jgi:hypothetical protein
MVIFTGEPLDTFIFLYIDRPDMILIEHLSPWGLIPVTVQPIGYSFEIPSIFFMKFTDDIIQLLLVRGIWGCPEVGTGKLNPK